MKHSYSVCPLMLYLATRDVVRAGDDTEGIGPSHVCAPWSKTGPPYNPDQTYFKEDVGKFVNCWTVCDPKRQLKSDICLRKCPGYCKDLMTTLLPTLSAPADALTSTPDETTYNTQHLSPTELIIIIVIVTLVAVLIVALISTSLIFWRRQKRKRMSKNKSNLEKSTEDSNQNVSSLELQIACISVPETLLQETEPVFNLVEQAEVNLSGNGEQDRLLNNITANTEPFPSYRTSDIDAPKSSGPAAMSP